MEYGQIGFFEEDHKIKGKEKTKTVISASRRTDIPTFFYNWLQDALEKGSVQLPNPVFRTKTYTVDLKPENVHSIVLWSKNFKNVLEHPMHLENYNLYFQYTINGYSRALEPNVPEYGETMNVLCGLLKKYRPGQFNIRFDPIILSTKGENNPTPEFPEQARLAVFKKLCGDLRILGINRVTTSYLALYGHVKSSLDKCGVDIVHYNEEEQLAFFGQMVEIADKYGISVYSCACPVLEQVEGMKKGRCIDGELLEQLFGGRVKKGKDTGQRPACGCSPSRDIGIYASGPGGMKCLHGCKYCYSMP
jgi:hypothetical protein